ncbi:sulfite exporter TauE/SafE family protein [Rhodovarius crocodyli]|uniref:Probable membrane transporter protein n=1 Tax=Rhodovarius crocodyli TaxID=1979269 RepID=A0A437MG71_9PROT|nr:sulfite exporter TauE/SafE family protein [Rhodovarius crocodyli]RVT96660.1 sulfite exporter TauE/SafE family protein [Rhodovarius crocodyli]
MWFLLGGALVAGLARGFSGFGAALIFMPLASAAIGARMAAPLLLAVDGITSLGLLPRAWAMANRREVAVMTMGCAMGTPIGTYVLTHADPLFIRWAIVGVVIMALALLMSGWRYRGQPRAALTLGVGAASGLFSGVAQVGGPPVVAYWLGGSIPVATVRANIMLYFAAAAVVTGISFAVAGLFVRDLLYYAILTAPLYAVGVFIGSRLFGLASERTFRRVCYGLIVAAALLGLPLLDGVLR